MNFIVETDPSFDWEADIFEEEPSSSYVTTSPVAKERFQPTMQHIFSPSRSGIYPNATPTANTPTQIVFPSPSHVSAASPSKPHMKHSQPERLTSTSSSRTEIPYNKATTQEKGKARELKGGEANSQSMLYDQCQSNYSDLI